MAAHPLLTAFWIVPTGGCGPLGFGVTAYSLDDALRIIRDFGYELPADIGTLRVTEGVRATELEPNYVRANMGPIVVRGLWYPFQRVGL